MNTETMNASMTGQSGGEQRLAPVALFVYNRPEHTRKTLEALANNTHAPYTDLVVFSDGPKNSDAADLVREVRSIVRAASGFATLRVVERDANRGLANSIIAGVTELIDTYGAAIVVEDDLITSRHFLAYMNQALAHYAAMPEVFSITGYCYPPRLLAFPHDYHYDTFASYRCHSWGWATWKDRWDKVDWSVSDFEEFMSDEEAQNVFNRGGDDLTNMLGLQMDGMIDSWAIRFCYAHFRNDAYCMYPVQSLISNIGFDGSGCHCAAEDNPLRATELDDDWVPKKFSSPQINQEIARSYKAVHNCSTPDAGSSDKKTFLRRVFRYTKRLASRLIHKEQK